MFYRMTRRVMTWWRLLNPPQGVEMPPLPAVELVEFTNARGQVELREVRREGNTIMITRMDAEM